MAIALQNIGVDARSWLGWQVPFKTDSTHSSARIQSIEADEIANRLSQGQVAVVAGFQGISEEGRITTLGRGGSDTSAVALAAALGADRCDIYTDVDGVYTTDPRIMPKARKLDQITFEEMLEMASAGAKVLQTRSVAMGMRHNVKIQVRSSFNDEPGTMVVDEDNQMEQQKISGIAYSADEARITVVGLQDKPGVAAGIFKALAEAHVNIDMIVQSGSASDDTTDITFSVGAADCDKAIDVINSLKQELPFSRVDSDTNIAKISIIGTAMRTQAGIANMMFSSLSDKGVNLHVISTSEIKISVLIDSAYTELAVRTLHDAFELHMA